MRSSWPRLRPLLRSVLPPIVLAAFTGVELHRLGALVAAVGAYLTFLGGLLIVDRWGHWQLRRARRRLALARQRAERLRAAGR